MTHFIHFHKVDDVCHVTNLFFKEMVGLHGLLESIVSNKDSKFLSSKALNLWSNSLQKVDDDMSINMMGSMESRSIRGLMTSEMLRKFQKDIQDKLATYMEKKEHDQLAKWARPDELAY
ncbi:hypothetical protein CR513_45208, partial [Mucuna pruriens]